MAKFEYNKAELGLALDSFDEPKKLYGIQAWVSLFLNLLFMRKGSFPSQPEMGIDIKSYEFEFMDNAIRELETNIATQVELYLPDIPLRNVTVREYSIPNRLDDIILIMATFVDDGKAYPVAITTDSSNKRIDFEVSM